MANSFTVNTWTTVNAKLVFVGSSVLLYIDTLAPANGFTAAQLTTFGQLFDQTMYPIDTAAFGAPSDIDQNGRIIMLMSPVVNADSPKATCATMSFVEGFYDETDFNGPTDPNSNQGEIFYTIVPDPAGTVSCAHTVADLGSGIPATFLHEMQHLISYSQHVVLAGGGPGEVRLWFLLRGRVRPRGEQDYKQLYRRANRLSEDASATIEAVQEALGDYSVHSAMGLLSLNDLGLSASAEEKVTAARAIIGEYWTKRLEGIEVTPEPSLMDRVQAALGNQTPLALPPKTDDPPRD